MLNYMYKLHLKNVRSQIPLLEQVIFMSHGSCWTSEVIIDFGLVLGQFLLCFGSVLDQFWVSFWYGFGLVQAWLHESIIVFLKVPS